MDKEKLAFYANKYKKTQIRLSLIFMIIIMIIGLSLIGVGIFLIVYEPETYRIIVASIMILLGLTDIPLGYKFYQKSKKSIIKMKDEDAIKRYAKIYGVTPEELKDEKK